MRHSNAIQNFFDDFAIVRPLLNPVTSFTPLSAKPGATLSQLQRALQMPQSRPRAMATDLVETSDGYEYHIEVPGFKKEEISIEVQEGILSVEAKKAWNNEAKKDEAPATESGHAHESSETEPKELATAAPTHYLHKERVVQSALRRYSLPNDTDAATIEAKFENGVLILSVKKIVKQEPVSTKIQIS